MKATTLILSALWVALAVGVLRQQNVLQDYGPISGVLKILENLHTKKPRVTLWKQFMGSLRINTDVRYAEWINFFTGSLSYNPATINYSPSNYGTRDFRNEVDQLIMPLNAYQQIEKIPEEDKKNLKMGKYLDLIPRFGFLYRRLAEKYAISQLYNWGKINRKLQTNLGIFEPRSQQEGGPLNPTDKLRFLRPHEFEDHDDLSQEELKFPLVVVNNMKNVMFSTIVKIASQLHRVRPSDGFRKSEPFGIDLLDRGQPYFESAVRKKIDETIDQVHNDLRKHYTPLVRLQNHLVWNLLASLDGFLVTRWRTEESKQQLFERIGFLIELAAHAYSTLGKLEKENRIEFYQPVLRFLLAEIRRCKTRVENLKLSYCLGEVNEKTVFAGGVILKHINPDTCLRFVRDVQDVQMHRFEGKFSDQKIARLNQWWTAPPDFFSLTRFEAAKVLYWISFDQSRSQENAVYRPVLESFGEQGPLFLNLTFAQLEILKITSSLFKETVIEDQLGREFLEAQYFAVADFVADVDLEPETQWPLAHSRNLHHRFSEYLTSHRDPSRYSKYFIILMLHVAATNPGSDYIPSFGYLDIEQWEYAEQFMRNKEGQKLLDCLNAVLVAKGLDRDPLFETISGKIDLFRFNNCSSLDLAGVIKK